MTISKLFLLAAFLVFLAAAFNVFTAHVSQVSMLAAGLALLVVAMWG